MHGHVIGFSGIDRDITERKRAEQTQQFMYNISHAASMSQNLTDLYETIHSQLNTLFDATNLFIAFYNEKDDMLSMAYMKDQKDNYTKIPISHTVSAQIIKYNRPLLLREKEILELSNKIGTVGSPSKIWMGVPLQDNGEPIGVLVVQSYNDPDAYNKADLDLLGFVSKQISISIIKKRAEEALKKSENNFRLIFNNTAAGIAVFDTKVYFKYVNRRLSEITGYAKEDILNMQYKEMLHPEDFKMIEHEMNSLVSEDNNTFALEHKLVHKDQTTRWVELSVSARSGSSDKVDALIAIVYDITDRRHLQDQLIQTQKMETIGTMAGGIAHDFNNILTVINGYSEVATMKLDPKHPVHKYIEAIKSAGDRAESLTRQILAFSRKQIYQPRSLDLNDLLRELQKMTSRLISENIEIQMDFTANIPFIKADPSQIEQILINIIVNARDAINDCQDKNRKKQIRVCTGMLEPDSKFRNKFVASQSEMYVFFSVADTGVGMDEQVRQKLFEPFFTTKAKGKGTGLGMATVYGIVKQNHALIDVDSELKRGTTITVYWPADESSILDNVKKELNSADLNGTEKILLVEDEEDVRRFASKALRELGYRIETASNGKEALEKIAQADHSFDLVFTDVIMPVMSGKELRSKLSQSHPKLPILFASGYTDNELVHEGEIDKKIHFINKPYSIHALLVQIRSVLEGS